MAMRPQNRCRTCFYTWYPRGKNVSSKCPNCGRATVEVVVLSLRGCGSLLLVVVCAVYLLFGSAGSREPTTPPPQVPPPPAAPASRDKPSATERTEKEETRALPVARDPAPPVMDPIAKAIAEAEALAATGNFEEALTRLRAARGMCSDRQCERDLDQAIKTALDGWQLEATTPRDERAADTAASTPLPSLPTGRQTETVTRIRIVLKTGRVIEGELVREDRDEFVVKVEQGTLGVDRQYIESFSTQFDRATVVDAPETGGSNERSH